MAEVTRDAIFGGRVALLQPARSTSRYRVNVDALLLAAFAARVLPGAATSPRASTPRRARAAFDLGSGVGAVGLSLLHLGAATHVTMVESDGVLAQLARENAEANAWSDRVAVLESDVAEVPSGVADLVVVNPPYVPPGRGRTPAAPRAAARYGSLGSFVEAARHVAGRRARVCFVYPSVEATTLLHELRRSGLEPKRLRAVHGRANGDARVVLVEAVAGRLGGLVLEPPLVETDERGRRTPEMTTLLDPS